MPLPKISLTVSTAAAARSAELIVVPFSQGTFRVTATLSEIAPSAATFIKSVVKQKKVTDRSPALSLTLQRAARGGGVVSVVITPSEFSEKKDTFERLQALRALGSSVADHARRCKARSVAVDTSLLKKLSDEEQGALVEGLLLSLYSFDAYRSKPTPLSLRRIVFVGGALSQSVLKKSEIVCESVALARDLVNSPARDCTPTVLKRTAARLARDGRLGFKTFNSAALTKMGADMLMSVFRSSNETPYLLTLTYRPRKARKVVAIVGKGVTFDSGGLSIKSGSGMFDMKCDMAGAAAVLATMQAVSRLKPDVEVRGYIPTTENMINADSTRPGDVVRALNGKTVEVLNTDAEGRLILGDTLTLADRAKPDVIIDLATLTGAVIAALGSDYAGIFSTSDTLSEALTAASTTAGERLWRLPLAPEYKDKLKSMVADMKNIGGSEAGSITAALFLSEFVQNREWAHIDIAGPAFNSSDKLATPRGGSGFAVRTLIAYLTSSH